MALAAELGSLERGAAAAAAAASSAAAEMRLVADTAGEVETLREEVSPHISPISRPYLPIGCDVARGGISPISPLYLPYISPISPHIFLIDCDVASGGPRPPAVSGGRGGAGGEARRPAPLAGRVGTPRPGRRSSRLPTIALEDIPPHTSPYLPIPPHTSPIPPPYLALGRTRIPPHSTVFVPYPAALTVLVPPRLHAVLELLCTPPHSRPEVGVFGT